MNRLEILNLPRDDPRYIEHMRKQLAHLRYRMVREITALHYLVAPDGVTCLDFNISASSIRAMDALVDQHISEMGDLAVIPAPAPDEAWMKMASLPETSQHIIYSVNGLLRFKVSVHAEE